MPYKDKVKRAQYDKLRPSKDRVRKHRSKHGSRLRDSQPTKTDATHPNVTHHVTTPVTHHDDMTVEYDCNDTEVVYDMD